jgi:lipoprotein signal peptidase
MGHQKAQSTKKKQFKWNSSKFKTFNVKDMLIFISIAGLEIFANHISDKV